MSPALSRSPRRWKRSSRFGFEDPLFPEFSESWMAVRRSTRVPILTGESLALIEGFMPFIQNQAVDYPATRPGPRGGSQEPKSSPIWRRPIACPSRFTTWPAIRSIALRGNSRPAFTTVRESSFGSSFDEAPEAAGNIPVVKNGHMQVAALPGLGIILDEGLSEGQSRRRRAVVGLGTGPQSKQRRSP